MPLRYVCKRCGAILYYYGRDKHILVDKELRYSIGILTPQEVSTMLNGKCPKCGRVLEPPPASEWINYIEVELK